METQNTARIETPLQRLKCALDDAYEVFAIYPRPKFLDASPVVRDVDGMFRDITSGPLRTLEADQLWRFAQSAVWTVGDVNDYKHFFPRILDLAATQGSLIGVETIAFKLKNLWSEWPIRERQIIERVFLTAFEYGLHRGPYELNAWEWLVAVDQLGMAIEEALLVLFDATSAYAMAQWAELINKNATKLMIDKDFKEPVFSPKTHHAIREHLLSKTLAEQLFEVALEGWFPDENKRFNVERAYDTLASLREE